MANEVIKFPNVEVLLVAALKPKFAPIKIHTTVPKEYQPKTSPAFIRLTRVGGPKRDLITDQPMVVFQAWAGTNAMAGDLASELQAQVYALEHTGDFRGMTEVGGLQSFPDQISDSPCYQFTVQIQTRGKVIA